MGEKGRGGAAGFGLGGEFDCAGAEGRPVCVAAEDGLYQFWKPDLGSLDRSGDCVVGNGGGELRVGGQQVGDAVFKPLVAGVNRHRKPRKDVVSAGMGDASLRLRRTTLVKLSLFPLTCEAVYVL